MKKLAAAFFLVLMFSSDKVQAEYVAIGPIEGNVCQGWGIQVCGRRKLEAVKDDGGRLHKILKIYAEVSEFKESSSRCFIKTKFSGLGLLSSGVNAVKQPVFLERTSTGELKELNVDYITFKCIKR